jgi:L-proline amide hydrolase
MDMTRRTAIASSMAVLATQGLAAPLPTGVLLPGARLKPDREEMIPVPGGRAYVRINGDLAGPRPPIVMIHGGPGSSHWYFLNGTALADERAVILYDQLDSGRSDTLGDPANWHVPRFLAELDAIRAALKIARWHVLGASWGGTIALEYAATRPPSLASAILQSGLVSTRLWMRDANRLRARMPVAIRRTLDACDQPGAADGPDCQAAMDAFYARHIRMFDPPAEIAAYKAAMPRSFSPDIYHHLWGWAEFSASGTLRDYDGTPLLAKLDGPRTLFVTGQHDEALPTTIAGFSRKVKGATFREVPDAAHSIMNDNPAAYVALLRDWMARHDA